MGANEESKVFIHSDDAIKRNLLESMKGDSNFGCSENTKSNSVDDLRFLLIVSEVEIVDTVDTINKECAHVLSKDLSESSVTIGVTKAKNLKCERCWIYCRTASQGRDLCDRCDDHIIKTDNLPDLINKQTNQSINKYL